METDKDPIVEKVYIKRIVSKITIFGLGIHLIYSLSKWANLDKRIINSLK
jgi:hypothetical protein